MQCGLTYGAIALYEEIPGKALAVIEKCLKSNLKVLGVYGPDGGYPEGFHYWGYGTSFQVMLIAALESAFGDDKGLADAPGFEFCLFYGIYDGTKWRVFQFFGYS